MEVEIFRMPRRHGKTTRLLELAKGQVAQFITTCARNDQRFLEAGHVPYNGQGGNLLLIDEVDHVNLPDNFDGYKRVVATTSNPDFTFQATL